MRELWTEWRRNGSSCRTKKGNLKQPTRQDAINWVSIAWGSISIDIITKSFLHCGIANEIDGSEDHFIRDSIPSCLSERDDSEDDEDPFAHLDGEVDRLGTLSSDEDSDGESPESPQDC